MQTLTAPSSPPGSALARAPAFADDSAALLRFNRQLIGQALDLVSAFETPGAPPFAAKAGPHLRHVIEHFEALFFSPLSAQPGEVDYDGRARDRALEASPALTRRRLQALQARVQACADMADHPLRVHGLCGLQGDAAFCVPSSWLRELAFVASHAVHHYALLQLHCQQHGLNTPATLGQAAATVAHARASGAGAASAASTAPARTPAGTLAPHDTPAHSPYTESPCTPSHA